MYSRVRVLPNRGTLLISTDVHGNAEDLRVMEAVFRREMSENPATYWAILGDLVHGPTPEAARRRPKLYGYPDESASLPAKVIALQREFKEHLLYVLGNHDYSHIGGPKTGKFHEDEAGYLEATMKPLAIAAMRGLFRTALLAVVAPCGALLCHGSPNDTLEDLAQIGDLQLPATDPYQKKLVGTLLNSYGQPEEVSRRMLENVSRSGGIGLRMVIHGHDRDEGGWHVHEGTQAQPVMFGALRENKRYLRLELHRQYRSVDELREGVEVLRVYPELSPSE